MKLYFKQNEIHQVRWIPKALFDDSCDKYEFELCDGAIYTFELPVLTHKCENQNG